jgi:DNA-binding response OmpR family regulator
VAHLLLAADADWVVDQVRAALDDRNTSWTLCRSGKEVVPAVAAADTKGSRPDLALLDLQIGTMGGMAICMDLRLEESGGRLPHVPVIMLLDRLADVFLAKRSGADGWLIKPLDSLRLRKAARLVLAGGTYHEGVPAEEPTIRSASPSG